MPELCRIGSVKVMMWLHDHGPPHIHLIDGRRKDKLYFEQLRFETGRLQPRQQRQVLEWAQVRQAELRRAWRQASSGEQPNSIEPIE